MLMPPFCFDVFNRNIACEVFWPWLHQILYLKHKSKSWSGALIHFIWYCYWQCASSVLLLPKNVTTMMTSVTKLNLLFVVRIINLSVGRLKRPEFILPNRTREIHLCFSFCRLFLLKRGYFIMNDTLHGHNRAQAEMKISALYNLWFLNFTARYITSIKNCQLKNSHKCSGRIRGTFYLFTYSLSCINKIAVLLLGFHSVIHYCPEV